MSERVLRVIGAITFLGILMIAMLFEEERTTFVDIAFHMYVQATTGEVAIQNFRFVSAITQWLPTQLLNAEVDMKMVQLAYSLVFPFFYGAVWAFTHFVLKAKQWALAWALLWLTFATHTYFWIQSELPQGLAVFVVALGLMQFQSDKKWAEVLAKAVLPILLVTVAFAHPLAIVPVTFSFGLLWLLKAMERRELLAYGAIYFGAFIVRSIYFRTYYDDAAVGGIKVGIKTFLKGEIPYSLPHFIENLASTYYAFVIVAALGIWLLYKAGEKLAASWTLLSILGHISLVALSYSTSSTQTFYIENLYLPAGFMAASGLAFGIYYNKTLTVSKPMFIGIIAFSLLRMGHIAWVGETIYAPRLDYLQGMLDQYQGYKVILKVTPEMRENLIMTWGTGYEAWVISARNHKPTQGFLIHDNPEDLRSALDDPERLMLNFHQPKFKEISKVYFENPDSLNGYSTEAEVF